MDEQKTTGERIIYWFAWIVSTVGMAVLFRHFVRTTP
jgi:hypothetical protein